MQKSEILLSLFKNGWTVHTTWTYNLDSIILKIESRPPSVLERIYVAKHAISMREFSLIKEKDYALDCLELRILNQLYQTVLNEQDTKVL